MSIGNINGMPSANNKQGRGFEFPVDEASKREEEKKVHINEYRRMKEEIAALIRQQDEGKVLREKLGNAGLNKAGNEIEAELGENIALVRKDMKAMEDIMDSKGIRPEEYRDQ